MCTNITLEKFESICRICLDEKEKMCLIATSNIMTMIEECSSVNISIGDQLPQQICIDCVKRLENAYQLRLECEASDRKLRELVKLKIEKTDNDNHFVDIKAELASDTIKNESFDHDNVIRSDLNQDSCEVKHDSSEFSEDSSDDNYQQPINKYNISLSKGVEGELKKSYVCELCDAKFNKSWHLGIHMKQTHKSKGTKCNYCSKICYHLAHLKVHEQLHTKSSFKCDICSKQFFNGQALSRHKNSHTTERPFHCLQCNNSFKDKWSLKKHVNTIHVNPEKRVSCEICNKELLSRHLEQHLQIHQQRPTYPCGKCPKKFFHISSLKKHVQHEHENGQKFKRLCNICGLSVGFEADLKRHLLTHTGEKPYACDKCDKKYRTTYMLKTHISRTHLNQRNHICSFCSRGFFNRLMLLNHERTHTGEKPFSCETCNKNFISKGKLTEHNSRIHFNKQSHMCSICSGQFCSRRNLNRHIKKTHSDQKSVIRETSKTTENVV